MLDDQDERHLRALVIAALNQHAAGNAAKALAMLQEARKRGFKRADVARLLIENIQATLRSSGSFDPAKGTAAPEKLLQSPPPNLYGISEDVAKELRDRVESLRESVAGDPAMTRQFTIISTEIELLQHELSIAQSRGQLAKRMDDDMSPPASLENLNARWEENLRQLATSQLGQDLWVLQRCQYKRGGFFVEFGATNGVLLSNTHLLEKEFGWNGICAEPNPHFFEELKRNRLCTTSSACIGPVTGEQVEFVFAGAYGGMARDIAKDEHKEKREAYMEAGESALLTTVSLHDFLIQENAPNTIDYISIDTEGSEFSILEHFPFGAWNVRHITVEHNYSEQRMQLRRLLEGHGYRCIETMFDDWYYLE